MKKSRLFEIIREEIAAALNELEKGEVELPKGTPASTVKYHTDKGFDVKFVDPATGKMAQKESQIDEEQLNETPVYDVNDMEGFKSTLDKFREEGISKSKSLNLLLKKLEDEGTVDTNALSKEFGVDTATFNNKEIRKFLNRPQDEFFQDKSGDELIDFTPYLDKSDKPRGRAAGEKSEPKEKSALPDSGITKKEKKEEPKKEKKAEKEEPKKATLTKGDDGFDDVSYSKPKKEEPKKEKESSEDKADKAAKGGSKLDKMSDSKDQLLKALKKAKEERLAVAEKRKNAKSEAEKEKLFDELKRINKLEGELQKRIDKLGY
jgi:hypothetical protein